MMPEPVQTSPESLSNVLAELLEISEQGQPPDRNAWTSRYPQFAAELEEFFTSLEHFEPWAAPLRAVAHGLVPTPRPAENTIPCERTDGAAPLAPDCMRPFLPDYDLLAEIGKGGMGVVYKARQISLNRLVAVKIIRASGPAPEDDLRRFRNEAEAVAHLDHPHIVPVHEVREHAGQHYFTMKLIEGDSLDRQLARFSAEPKAAARLMVPVARAVHHAHQRGILHRDLKPGNILVDAAGQPHVADFGLAKRLETDSGLTQSGVLVGTPSYMAPEQATGGRQGLTTAADIYGLGAVLYALLTGRPPYQGQTVLETLEQVKQGEPVWPSSRNPRVDRELEAICLKCLHKEPARRYSSAEALAEDLESWLKGEPIEARPVGRAERLWRWTLRHRAGAAGAVGLLLVMVAVSGTFGLAAWKRLAQRRVTEREANAALDEAARLQHEGRLPEALAAARRAVWVTDAGAAEDALSQRVHSRRDDLELVAELEEARLQTTVVKDGRFDFELGDHLYGEAFRKAGLNVEVGQAADKGERIRRSSVAAELAVALDHWAMTRRNIKGQADPSWKHLLRVARVADPDQWRDRMRNALAQGNRQVLIDLARSADVLRQPRLTLATLGLALQLRGAVDPAVVLLREARKRNVGDFWVNEDLGKVLMSAEPPQWEEAIRFYTAAVALRPQSPGARHNLGNALGQKGRFDDAIAEFQEAIRLKKDFAEAHCSLGVALKKKGRLDESIAEYREAIRLKKDYADAHNNLGNALHNKGQLDEAITECREAIRLKKDFPKAHCNLGMALGKKGQLDEAIAEFQEAIRLKKDDAEAHNNLGVGLKEKRFLDEAIEEFREAIRLEKGSADAHSNLGMALGQKGLLDEAITELQEAIRLKRDYANAYYGLGLVLNQKGLLDEAIAEFQKAVRLKKDFAEAHFCLGMALFKKGLLDEAIAEFQKAVRLKKNNPDTHYNLGIALQTKGQLDKAIAEYRQALRLKKDYPEAQCNLGHVLRVKGQFAEALTYLRRGHELGSKNQRWPYPSAQWVRTAEQLVTLDSKLPKVLRGEAQPADAAERVALAQLCQTYKKRYAVATRFYAAAFAAQPALADRLSSEGSRYDAACAAALAGLGQGKDAAMLNAKERVGLRRQALDWLRADLTAWRNQLAKDSDQTRPLVLKTMLHWQQDTDFAGVRGPAALAKLPETERTEWRKLWEEVAALRQRAAMPPRIQDQPPK